MRSYQFSFPNWLIQKIGRWLLKENPPHRSYLCDFNRICQEVRQADVLLIEGRSRISEIVKQITQSPWSHAVLYIGHPDEISDPDLREIAKRHSVTYSSTQLIIESDIGLGTIISPIEKYQHDHIRILRPAGLSKTEAQNVILFALRGLGTHYNIRHILDLARFLLPWRFLPHRFRSTLFQHNALKPTEEICSSMIARAFESVNFPVLPLVHENEQKNLELIRRNPRLYTPSDFDYSPYFAVIKYPINFKGLPWRTDVISNDDGDNLTSI